MDKQLQNEIVGSQFRLRQSQNALLAETRLTIMDYEIGAGPLLNKFLDIEADKGELDWDDISQPPPAALIARLAYIGLQEVIIHGVDQQLLKNRQP